MDVFGTSPDVALLVVISVGILGGSLTGAVIGFSIGLLIDCLLLETMGAFALTLLSRRLRRGPLPRDARPSDARRRSRCSAAR